MQKELAQLNKLIKKQEGMYHQLAKKSGLTDSKFWVMYALVEAGGTLCQNVFCNHYYYPKQTVNTAVTSLEKDGYVYLELKDGSKKQKDIKLAPLGEAFCDEYIRPLMQKEEDALLALEKNQRETFFQTFAQLVAYFDEEL